MPDPVVVTGLGVVTARATGLDEFWATRGTAPLPGSVLALGDGRPRHPRRFGDLVTRVGLDVATQAWRQAGLPDPAVVGGAGGSLRTGVVWGVGLAGLRAAERGTAALAAGRDPAPHDILALSPAEPVAALARRCYATGPCRGIATACASATDAIADAARLVAAGVCDVVVAGGAEAGATAVNVAGLARVGVLSPSGTARPFDAARDGLVLAEGAAAVVLESSEHARRRGARPLATVAGAASARDPGATAVAPGPDGGVFPVLRAALADAGLDPTDLVAVLAHATGTVAGDAAEATGLVAAVGDGVPVTAGKGATGHAMAASGALAAVEAVLALQHGRLPPVVGLRVAADGAARDLDLVTGPRPVSPGPVATLSSGFGGFTAALVLAPA